MLRNDFLNLSQNMIAQMEIGVDFVLMNKQKAGPTKNRFHQVESEFWYWQRVAKTRCSGDKLHALPDTPNACMSFSNNNT